MADLLAEVERFRSWAAAYPVEHLSGEWEIDYEDWHCLYAAVLEFVDRTPFQSWTDEELSAILYALARDNEMQHLVDEIADRGDDVLLDLTEASIRIGEPDAKWQLADKLRQVTTNATQRDQLLLTLVRDENENVRRRSLGSLAMLGSPATEELALDAWSRADESQQWARMMALWALHRVGSPHLERLLVEAERDERPHLSAYAKKVRTGDVDT